LCPLGLVSRERSAYADQANVRHPFNNPGHDLDQHIYAFSGHSCADVQEITGADGAEKLIRNLVRAEIWDWRATRVGSIQNNIHDASINQPKRNELLHYRDAVACDSSGLS